MESKLEYAEDAWGTSTGANKAHSNSTKLEVEITPAQVVRKENLVKQVFDLVCPNVSHRHGTL